MKKILFLTVLLTSFMGIAKELKLNDTAPTFTTQNQEGKVFDLASRKGKWTVLYFYPKAGTPGCTKQACAFRDSIDKIHALGAEVYGISSDDVKDQAAFHKEHKLNFDLLADPDLKILNLYGSKMKVLNMSNRWTFILDPELKIRNLMKDVDPMTDSVRVAKEISELQKKK
jgi:thioredoxin-dependent peroxiredoxin